MNLLRGQDAPTTSTPASGRRSRSRRRRSTRAVERRRVERGPELHLRARRSPRGSSRPTPPTCTSAPTRRSAASSTTGRPTRATCRWSPTCRRTSCRARRCRDATALIYGGAQKNIGPAGLTLVIVREDLLGHALPVTPSAFHWQEQAASRLDAQHAADLLDLRRGPRVRVAARAGRRWPAIEAAQRRKGEAPLRLRSTRRTSTRRRCARRTARA